MKLLTILRIILGAILTLWALPMKVLTLCVEEGRLNIFSSWKELVLIGVFFAFSWCDERLRKQRSLPSLYDKFNTEGIKVFKWVCLGTALLSAFLLWTGIHSLMMGRLAGQIVDGLFIKESDATLSSFYGLFVTYSATAALSASLLLFVSASLQLDKRKRTLRQSGPDA